MKKLKNKPIITVITVVFNGKKTIERAIKSVINQTARKNIEYIIIDGKSSDGTLEIIDRYRKKIDVIVSEKDKGIYDAMNKGVKLAKGEYIYFLGSDDYLYDNRVLEDISKSLINNNPDLIYGNVKIPLNREKIYPGKPLATIDFKLGKKICHQALFMKNKIIKDNGYFNLNYKISADWDNICKSIVKKHKISFINRIITVYSPGGASSKGNLIENYKILREYFGLSYSVRYLILQSSKSIIGKTIKFMRINR